ncbi:hypothetical protein X777_16938 [Ooceraea biroi]|uniref:Uncharacterized protein n=1 Tax=Ooceraea biroi TaxID=2015173 RepID=A0A026WV48_OOCBI|nr:hypothetical protein X777_16938 [Ooceraea biroi]
MIMEGMKTAGEPSRVVRKGELPPLLAKKTVSTTRLSSRPKETTVRIPPYCAPEILNNAKHAIMRRLNGLTPKRASPLFQYLLILSIYVGIHVLLAVIAWRTPAYQLFASSQICGFFAFLMWRISGTILI